MAGRLKEVQEKYPGGVMHYRELWELMIKNNDFKVNPEHPIPATIIFELNKVIPKRYIFHGLSFYFLSEEDYNLIKLLYA